jgi:ubiquinol-cytochrome c reductase cytochrome b subunit
MPSWDFTIGHYTLVPNPFWGGAAFPLVVFLFLYLWPVLERRGSGDKAFHNLLDRPRDAPVRTAIGVGMVTCVTLVFLAGGSDRVDVLFDLSYASQIWVYRFLVFLGPLAAALITYRVCRELQEGEHVEHARRLAEDAARAASRREDAPTKRRPPDSGLREPV